MDTRLVFTDYNNTFRVEFRTDIKSNTDDSFTVCQISGLDDHEVVLGMNYREQVYTVTAFKAFAVANGLKLTRVDADGETTLSDFSGLIYYNSGLGIDGL